MSSTHDQWRVGDEDQLPLLDVATESIRYGLEKGRAMDPELAAFSDQLCRLQSSFVTLRVEKQLRGCIGSIKVTQPLVTDVSRNAYLAAFCDPRLPALRDEELPFICIHVSVLSPLRQLSVRTLSDAIKQVNPGVDGVLIRSGKHVATFLPDVWEMLPEPTEFFQHLRRKAGLDPDGWNPDIRVSTYATQRLSRDAPHPITSTD